MFLKLAAGHKGNLLPSITAPFRLPSVTESAARSRLIPTGKEEPMLRSRTHPQTFAERLAEQKALLEKQASKLAPGSERDDLLRRARQIDTARDIDEWLNSPGLQAPR